MTDPTAVSSREGYIALNDLTVAPGYENVLRANGLDSLEALFTASGAKLLSKPGLSSWRERLRLTLDVGGERRTFYLKRFRGPPLRVRRDVRRSGGGASSIAGLEWTWMRRLAAEGIPCVSPVAFAEAFRGSRELRSAVLTAAVPGDSLERLAQKWRDGDRTVLHSLTAPLARLVARLHECGFIHRDLYFSHIFHDPASPPESSLHLIDLQRVIRLRYLHRRWIVKDLASLNFSAPSDLVSRTDRIRWLTQYLGASKLDASAKRLAYRIVGKTRRIARHEQSRAARWHKRSDDR